MNKLISFSKVILVVIFLSAIVVSCEKDSEVNSNETSKQKANSKVINKSQSNFTQFDVKYQNADGEYVSITEQQMKNFIINQFEMSSDLQFDFVEVVEEEQAVFVLAQSQLSSGNQAQFGVILELLEDGSGSESEEEGSYLISGKQCTCTGCPDGCHLEITGSTCNCTGCPFNEGSCIKTETGSTGSDFAVYSVMDFELPEEEV